MLGYSELRRSSSARTSSSDRTRSPFSKSVYSRSKLSVIRFSSSTDWPNQSKNCLNDSSWRSHNRLISTPLILFRISKFFTCSSMVRPAGRKCCFHRWGQK
uniref:(northern house mosquito) hypothetical protein n=1 Tax=Culex pipiens TaxID=7175 RepID=A0A8D8BGS2_CULPI